LEQEIRDALTADVLRQVGAWWEKKHRAGVRTSDPEWQHEATIQMRGMLMDAIRPVLAQAAENASEPR
jgi:hypothetical protein